MVMQGKNPRRAEQVARGQPHCFRRRTPRRTDSARSAYDLRRFGVDTDAGVNSFLVRRKSRSMLRSHGSSLFWTSLEVTRNIATTFAQPAHTSSCNFGGPGCRGLRFAGHSPRHSGNANRASKLATQVDRRHGTGSGSRPAARIHLTRRIAPEGRGPSLCVCGERIALMRLASPSCFFVPKSSSARWATARRLLRSRSSWSRLAPAPPLRTERTDRRSAPRRRPCQRQHGVSAAHRV